VTHSHAWQPIEGECAKYACECGATGYRSRTGIQEHKTKPALQRKWTAMSARKPPRPAEDWQSWDKEE
jgi:hypothetical protein